MMILYFTSTGNNLQVARELGGTLYSIPKEAAKNHYAYEDTAIGLVFPVYGLCVPPFIRDFINKASFTCKYLFAIMTYGSYKGAVVTQLVKLGEQSGKHFSYINTIQMVQNYLPGYSMEKEVNKAESYHSKEQITAVCQDVHEKKVYLPKDTRVNQWLTRVHDKHYHYNTGEGVAASYQVRENCNGCGVCEQLCPQGNIIIQEGKPIFNRQCISCLSCAQNCPKKAIALKGEKGQGRYRNPNVSLKDIINANSTLTE